MDVYGTLTWRHVRLLYVVQSNILWLCYLTITRAQSLLLTLGALVHQVYIFRRTAEILGVQLKILGAKLQILRAPTLKDQKYTPKRVTLKIATRALCSNVGPYFSSI